MRGKLLSLQVLSVCTRITPAGAGKTKSPALLQFTPQDHPRRCGENSSSLPYWLDSARITPAGAGKTPHCGGVCVYLKGSPPQVRGKLSSSISAQYSVRITPAGAGKTYCIAFNSVDLPGSPPQVRGKLGSLSHSHVQTRITPAGAGKTCNNVLRNTYDWDHPRRCGENKNTPNGVPVCSGSPPQVRGKPCSVRS